MSDHNREDYFEVVKHHPIGELHVKGRPFLTLGSSFPPKPEKSYSKFWDLLSGEEIKVFHHHKDDYNKTVKEEI